MAIEHAFDIGTPATAERVEAVLSSAVETGRLARPGHGSRVDRAGTVLGGGGHVSAYASPPLPFPDPMEEVFGFVPVVHVSFRISDPQSMPEHNHNMIVLLTAALSGVEGDAWFGANGEITYLTRIAGRITVDTDKTFWTPELVALLPQHDTAALENM